MQVRCIQQELTKKERKTVFFVLKLVIRGITELQKYWWKRPLETGQSKCLLGARLPPTLGQAAVRTQIWKVSKNGDPTVALLNLCQYCSTLTVKKSSCRVSFQARIQFQVLNFIREKYTKWLTIKINKQRANINVPFMRKMLYFYLEGQNTDYKPNL